MSARNGEHPIYTTGQVAKICGVAARTVTKWTDADPPLLLSFRLPGALDRRVYRDDLIRFLRWRGMRGVDGGLVSAVLLVGLPEALAQETAGAFDPAAGVEALPCAGVFEAGRESVLHHIRGAVIDFGIGRASARHLGGALLATAKGGQLLIALVYDDESDENELRRAGWTVLRQPVTAPGLVKAIRAALVVGVDARAIGQ